MLSMLLLLSFSTFEGEKICHPRISFRPLYGLKDSEPLCSILEIEGRTILLDCGWTDDFDVSLIEPLQDGRATAYQSSYLFADFDHIGALPYAVAHFGLDAPIYSTIPTYQMGGVLLRDAYGSTRRSSRTDLVSRCSLWTEQWRCL